MGRFDHYSLTIDNLRELFAAPLAHSQESDLLDGLLVLLANSVSYAQYLAYAENPDKIATYNKLINEVAAELPRLADDSVINPKDLRDE